MMNKKGVKFIHERTTPLHISTMDAAATAIFTELNRREARIKAGDAFPTDTTQAFARHLAWIIGFDALIDQRREIHNFVEKIV